MKLFIDFIILIDAKIYQIKFDYLIEAKLNLPTLFVINSNLQCGEI